MRTTSFLVVKAQYLNIKTLLLPTYTNELNFHDETGKLNMTAWQYGDFFSFSFKSSPRTCFEREKNIDVKNTNWLPPIPTPIGDWTHNLLVYRTTLQPTVSGVPCSVHTGKDPADIFGVGTRLFCTQNLLCKPCLTVSLWSYNPSQGWFLKILSIFFFLNCDMDHTMQWIRAHIWVGTVT